MATSPGFVAYKHHTNREMQRQPAYIVPKTAAVQVKQMTGNWLLDAAVTVR